MEIKIDCGDAGILIWRIPDELMDHYKKSKVDEGKIATSLVVAFEKPMQQFAHVLAAIANTRDPNKMHVAILDLGTHLALCAAAHLKRLRGRK